MDELNRRKFERMELTERAIAVDESGTQLGAVTEASGGGMLLTLLDEKLLASMQPGRRMRVTVVEPDLGTANTLDVEIRYVHENKVGVQFVNLVGGGSVK